MKKKIVYIVIKMETKPRKTPLPKTHLKKSLPNTDYIASICWLPLGVRPHGLILPVYKCPENINSNEAHEILSSNASGYILEKTLLDGSIERYILYDGDDGGGDVSCNNNFHPIDRVQFINPIIMSDEDENNDQSIQIPVMLEQCKDHGEHIKILFSDNYHHDLKKRYNK